MSTRCPELANIHKVIDLYIDGVQNGNLDAMRQAFHPQASMFGYKGKDLFVTPIQGLYDYIAGTTPPAKAGAVGKAYTCTITAISVVGNAAALGLIVRHDDAVREYAYDRQSPVGRLSRGLDEAPQRGWTVVSMKRDWKLVYPPAR